MKTASTVTKEKFDHEVQRLDRRVEEVSGVTEDRLVGKLAETESRIRRHMDRRFEEAAILNQRNYEHLEAKLGARIDAIDAKIDSLRQEMQEFRQEVREIIQEELQKALAKFLSPQVAS